MEPDEFISHSDKRCLPFPKTATASHMRGETSRDAATATAVLRRVFALVNLLVSDRSHDDALILPDDSMLPTSDGECVCALARFDDMAYNFTGQFIANGNA